MKKIWILGLCTGMLWASPQTQIKDKEYIAQSKYHQAYENLNVVMKKDIDNICLQKTKILSLAQKSSIVQSETYIEKVEAAKKGILMRMYLEDKRASIEVSESELKAYYDAHIQDYTAVHAYTLVRKKKEDLLPYLKTLEQTPKEKIEETFKSLASQYSQHPRKSHGGDMGFVGYHTIVKPFGAEAFALKENTFTSKPFKTILGWHIVYVKEKKVTPFEKVKKTLEEILRAKLYKEWFTSL